MSNWKDVRRQIDIVCQIVVLVNTLSAILSAEELVK